VVILCEDKLHRVFVTRLLKQYGYAEHDLRIEQCPVGSGSGESFVRRNYPGELAAYRSRTARAKTFLIVMIDADTGSVADREAQLKQACEQASVQPRQSAERVVHAIPKRAINTWLAWLDGQDADETTDYRAHGYAFRKCEAEVSRLVKPLHEMCKARKVPEDAPPSLKHACGEFARIRDRL
jgi:hypothetical protein